MKKRQVKRLERTAICPKCMRPRPLQKHHIFPVRFFGKKDNGYNRLYLCAECHLAVERLIPQHRKLTKEQYIEIHKAFLKGEENGESLW